MVIYLCCIYLIFANMTFKHYDIISISLWFIYILWILTIWMLLLLFVRISLGTYIHMIWKHRNRKLFIAILTSCWSLLAFLPNMIRIFLKMNSFMAKFTCYYSLVNDFIWIFDDRRYLIIMVLLTDLI